ncbi:MAG: ABC transporter substrate-binding protein [Gemmatimonadales bacterium]
MLRYVAALLGTALIACQPGDAPAGGEGGDTVPTRIVSLSPALTELVFALGAGDRLVGRTRWGNAPPEALEVPSVGDGLNPNVEAIVARRPDLVVFYAAASNQSAVERLRALDISTLSIRLDRLDDLARAARRLGDVLGIRARADSLVARLDGELAGVRAEGTSGPSVLVLAWENPPIVIGARSFLSEIVELAGARNAFGDLERPSAKVGLETIAARNPDVVLVVGGSEVPALADRGEWQAIEAVRERRFVAVDGTEFAWPSFRAPQAVMRLRGALERLAQ